MNIHRKLPTILASEVQNTFKDSVLDAIRGEDGYTNNSNIAFSSL